MPFLTAAKQLLTQNCYLMFSLLVDCKSIVDFVVKKIKHISKCQKGLKKKVDQAVSALLSTVKKKKALE